MGSLVLEVMNLSEFMLSISPESVANSYVYLRYR